MLLLIVYAVFCMLFALHDAVQIKHDVLRVHNRNGRWHVAWWLVGWAYCIWQKEYWLIPCFPLVGRLFFDTLLNVFRSKGLFYVSADAKKDKIQPNASATDYWEWHFFKSAWLPKVIYIVIIAGLIALHVAAKG